VELNIISMESYAAWVAVAVAFFAFEIFTPSFYLMWFGVGALAAGLVSFLFPGFDLWVQSVVFIAVSLLLVMLSRPISDRITKKPPVDAMFDALIDKTALVVEDLDSDKNKGRVRVNKEEWRAEAGERIYVGEKVRVLRVEGTHLVVEKINEGVE